MAVTCHIKIGRQLKRSGFKLFQEVPRAGEFVTFSRDGKRDERGVLHGDLFQVQRVIHTAATDLSPPIITVEVEQYADRT